MGQKWGQNNSFKWGQNCPARTLGHRLTDRLGQERIRPQERGNRQDLSPARGSSRAADPPGVPDRHRQLTDIPWRLIPRGEEPGEGPQFLPRRPAGGKGVPAATGCAAGREQRGPGLLHSRRQRQSSEVVVGHLALGAAVTDDEAARLADHRAVVRRIGQRGRTSPPAHATSIRSSRSWMPSLSRAIRANTDVILSCDSPVTPDRSPPGSASSERSCKSATGAR